jgi:hypothetical protein
LCSRNSTAPVNSTASCSSRSCAAAPCNIMPRVIPISAASAELTDLRRRSIAVSPSSHNAFMHNRDRSDLLNPSARDRVSVPESRSVMGQTLPRGLPRSPSALPRSTPKADVPPAANMGNNRGPTFSLSTASGGDLK